MQTTPSVAEMTASAASIPLLIVEEFSHRVINEYAQAVSALRIRASEAGSEEARRTVEAVAARLCNYADVHRALQIPHARSAIDLATHLETLCKALAAGPLQDRRVLLSLSGESVLLSAERCWRVALIVSELVTNAMRHGVRDPGGAILVRLESLGDTVACHVIDNGGVRCRPTPSRGLSVVKRLAEEMGGEARWTFGTYGTRAEVTIPIQEKELPC